MVFNLSRESTEVEIVLALHICISVSRVRTFSSMLKKQERQILWVVFELISHRLVFFFILNSPSKYLNDIISKSTSKVECL